MNTNTQSDDESTGASPYEVTTTVCFEDDVNVAGNVSTIDDAIETAMDVTEDDLEERTTDGHDYTMRTLAVKTHTGPEPPKYIVTLRICTSSEFTTDAISEQHAEAAIHDHIEDAFQQDPGSPTDVTIRTEAEPIVSAL